MLTLSFLTVWGRVRAARRRVDELDQAISTLRERDHELALLAALRRTQNDRVFREQTVALAALPRLGAQSVLGKKIPQSLGAELSASHDESSARTIFTRLNRRAFSAPKISIVLYLAAVVLYLLVEVRQANFLLGLAGLAVIPILVFVLNTWVARKKFANYSAFQRVISAQTKEFDRTMRRFDEARTVRIIRDWRRRFAQDCRNVLSAPASLARAIRSSYFDDFF